MTKLMTRKLSVAAIAGTMALGMSACTQVEGSSGTSSSSSSSSSSEAAPSEDSTSSSESPESSESSSPSEEPSSSSSSPSSSESNDDSGGDDSSGPKVGKVGQEVKTDKMSIKVSKVTDDVKSSSDYQKPAAGKHWVAINISATNLDDDELRFSSSCVKVRLSDNTSPSDKYVDYGSRLGYGSLYKGDTTTGDLVYEVSPGQKIKTIDVDCSYGDDRPVRIQAN